MKYLLFILVLQVFCGSLLFGKPITVYTNLETETIELGIIKLTQAADQVHQKVVLSDEQSAASLSILLDSKSGIAKEGYRLSVEPRQLVLTASDATGLLYGLLDIAEEIKWGIAVESIKERTETPRLQFRAIKYNLPYMAYRSDASTAQHFATCRDITYWEKFLDMMMENRFNVLSLWSLHLYHYMVIPENYPEATHLSYWEMQDWKNFWTQLFHMAKVRGIDTYIINWNTFVSPSFAAAHHVAEYSMRPWHYGKGDTNKIVMYYTREVLTQVINEYPELSGLGITLGERMGDQSPDERRGWLDSTFFAAMAQADRKIKFIYRAPLSANKGSGGSTSEMNDLKSRQQIEQLDTDGPVWVEFKYNWSHGHSSPDLFIVHGGKLTDKYRNPLPTKYKYIWTVRNEDFHVNRWGQSDFIRKFISNNATDYVGGCFIGSEGYIPAFDDFSKNGSFRTWQYAFERQWLFYAMWGRLLYNPNYNDENFARLIEKKYNTNLGNKILTAYKAASTVPLHFASYYQGRNDLSLYTEGFTAWREFKPVSFIDINKLIHHQVLDTIRYINIADYVKNKGSLPDKMMSPLQLADSLDKIATLAMDQLLSIRKQNLSELANCELQDIESWSWFGRYFAQKLRAGVALEQYRAGQKPKQQQQALTYLTSCVELWENYVQSVTMYNTYNFKFHTDTDVSWSAMVNYVKADIELAKQPYSNENK